MVLLVNMSALPVAPLVGAWIEIFYDVDQADVAKVAPLVGAWIEISKKATACSAVRQSLLSWERGLKFSRYIPCRSVVASWERGLKYRISLFEVKTKKSLLSRERGLKY